ncbi:MAG TPA: cysteine desulfurase family protein [Anaerolineaceae bacterium]
MQEKNRVYLDYAATTPVDGRVLEKMLPYFGEVFGNPSSIHHWGQQAEAALEESREKVAAALGCRPEEIIFTSCGTESDNLALRGAALAQRKRSGANHILISPVEHHAVLHTAHQLADEFGFDLELLPVDPYGMVDPADLRHYLRSETALVSVIYANNEIGTINPVAEIGAACREAGILFHSDAVQAAAHLPVNVHRDQIDLLAIGAHKFYGPKGIGALYARRDTRLVSTQTGGKQEEGRRAGTHNIPYIVGLAAALEIAQADTAAWAERIIPLRDHLIGGVLESIPNARLTGHPVQRLPNHASFVFDGVDGNLLLMLLDDAGFACSSGSACKTGNPQPSEVLTAIGLSRAWALGSLRVTLGRATTAEQIDAFLAALPELVLRAQVG